MTTMPLPVDPPDVRVRVDEFAAADGVRLVTVTGELDIASAPVLSERLTTPTGRATRLCIDLRGVTFIDSTALTTLVRAQRAQDDIGGFLALCCGDGPVKRLLELTCLHRQLPVYAELDDALAALTPRA